MCVVAILFGVPRALANQMEQVVPEKAHLQPGFVRCEPVATHFVPAQRVLAFLDPVLNITATIVHLDHLARRKPGVGYNDFAHLAT